MKFLIKHEWERLLSKLSFNNGSLKETPAENYSLKYQKESKN